VKPRFFVASLLLLALLAWSVVLPNVSVIAGSFARGLVDWRAFAASPADREALRSTLIISVGSVIAALLIGLPLAFLLGIRLSRPSCAERRRDAPCGTPATRGRDRVPVPLW
jgi:ABC-type Fe3+ transport system permease subunit